MSKENFSNSESKELSSKLEKFTTQELLARKKDESQLKNEIISKNSEEINGLHESKETHGEITEMVEGTHYEIKDGVFNLLVDTNKLQNVTSLFLYDHNLTDISALQGLKNLKNIMLLCNKLTDISALQGLKKITRINLGCPNISDISTLQGLMSLQYIEIGNCNKLTDISALQGLMSLQYIEIRNTNISDISAIQGLKNLTKIFISNTKISDISALQGLKKLKDLSIFNNNISDISALQGLKKLTNLRMSRNKISDISALQGLKKLGYLNIGNQGNLKFVENNYKNQLLGVISKLPNLYEIVLGKGLEELKPGLLVKYPYLEISETSF